MSKQNTYSTQSIPKWLKQQRKSGSLILSNQNLLNEIGFPKMRIRKDITTLNEEEIEKLTNALLFASVKLLPLIAERHFQGYQSKKTYLR